ncbi:hypothetical protein CLV98_10645 [Dyadobacter jejuensis]|uniref:Uncharacterized protein n=1 Tax=Dyadobacter jejuensis TaxID=1082580 RepID=A0A316AIH0_9BACT|nr:hypothetical protein CLV98_10645 [Dyadobacter jejuensis]
MNIKVEGKLQRAKNKSTLLQLRTRRDNKCLIATKATPLQGQPSLRIRNRGKYYQPGFCCSPGVFTNSFCMIGNR